MKVMWDAAKEKANRTKHRVSFQQASELLVEGADCLEIFDEEHSEEEDRFIAVGTTGGAVLVVVFTEPEADVRRIVSARKATRKERRLFERYEREQHEGRDS